MAKITVYKFAKWEAGQSIMSRRMITKQGAESITGVTLLEDTGVEIDESQLDQGEAIRRLTPIDFTL